MDVSKHVLGSSCVSCLGAPQRPKHQLCFEVGQSTAASSHMSMPHTCLCAEPTEPSEQPAAAEPSSPAGNTDSPSPGQKRTRDAAALDTTATVQPASKEAATALPTKRISLDCYSPAHCTSVGVGTGSSAHSDQHFLTELRIDRDGAPGGANTRMQTPSTAPSCGNYSCCNTAAVATRADEDANSTGSAHSAIHLPWGCSDKSVQHARATLARADSMHVSCSTKEQHNLVSAVKFVYKSVVARYCGHVCQNDIQKICRKGLQVVEEMLKGIYMCAPSHQCAPCHHCMYILLSNILLSNRTPRDVCRCIRLLVQNNISDSLLCDSLSDCLLTNGCGVKSVL